MIVRSGVRPADPRRASRHITCLAAGGANDDHADVERRISRRHPDPHRGPGLAAVRIANSSGPVLSDDMVLLLRAGKEVPWEPASSAALARQGLWNDRLIIDRIEAHEFAMVVTSGRPGTPLYDSRYSPGVSLAIEEAYPYTERIAGRT